MSEGRARLRARQFFGPSDRSADGWNEVSTYARDWERAYRNRWQHDRVVRSTHGVNCTGSCSWKIHVKDGLVTWETQETDYPTNGRDTPDYEPRGCPRGASFSWYIYSPLRPKHPYVRGVLLEMYREAKAAGADPVEAWASIVSDPDRARAYKSQRGKGGFLRATWRRRPSSSPPATSTRPAVTVPTGSPASRRSRRCRWSRTRPGRDSCR